MYSEKTTAADIQTVLNCEEQRRANVVAGDLAALGALLSNDLVYVHSSAVRDTKQSYLDLLQSGRLQYLSMAFSDLQTHAIGNCVVVTGGMSAEVSREGQVKMVRTLFMSVWLQVAGAGGASQWQMRAYQGTALPA